MAAHLFQPKSTTLLPYLRLMVNGRDIAFLDGMNTLLKEGDEVLIMPPVSGG
jgi:molybdopterin synthase sulfur carrier subunit